MRDYVTLARPKDRVIAAGRRRRAFILPTLLTIIFIPFGLNGAIRGYGYRWFGIGVEPMIPRRLGH